MRDDGRTNHDCEVDPKEFLLHFFLNVKIDVSAPIKVFLAFLNLFLCPVIFCVFSRAKVIVVAVVAANREVKPVDRAVLNQLTQYIYRNVDPDNDQIHVEVLV